MDWNPLDAGMEKCLQDYKRKEDEQTSWVREEIKRRSK